MVFRTMACHDLGEVFLLVHGPMNPDPQEWATLLQDARKKRQPKHLVIAGEVELTPRQRAQVAETLDYPCRAAVMLSSPITRGMVTAIGWLTGKHRAFSMTDLAGALAYLDVAPERYNEIRELIAELQRALSAQM